MKRTKPIVWWLLHGLSIACYVAGSALLTWPVVHTVVSGYATGKAQAKALAAWDHAPEQDESIPGRVMVLEIPRLGLRRLVPDGATVEILQHYGVGHISWTAFPPTEPGVIAMQAPSASSRVPAATSPMPEEHSRIVGIAGHRTTYGAPFFRIAELTQGDSIVLLYGGRRYVYSVERRITTGPNDSEVLDGGMDEVALVTCTPPLSAAFRLIVFGRLESIAAAATQ